MAGEPKVTLGQIAYTAYGDTVDWKNFQGNPMPSWEQLPDIIQRAWEAAAENAVLFVGVNIQLDGRDLEAIKHAHAYAKNHSAAGVPGHGSFLLLSKIAKALKL